MENSKGLEKWVNQVSFHTKDFFKKEVGTDKAFTKTIETAAFTSDNIKKIKETERVLRNIQIRQNMRAVGWTISGMAKAFYILVKEIKKAKYTLDSL